MTDEVNTSDIKISNLLQPKVVNTTWRSRFIIWLSAEGCSETTRSTYLYDLGLFERWHADFFQEEFDPAQMNLVTFQAYRKYELDELHHKPKTWNKRLAMIHKLVKWAVHEQLIQDLAIKGLERADEILLAPRWLTDQEFLRFVSVLERNLHQAPDTFAAKKAIRDHAICLLMSEAGLRESEVCKLTWGDVDVKERSGRVWIQNSKDEISGFVPLNKYLREALTPWMDLNPDRKSGELIFNGKGTDSLTPRTIQNIVSDVADQARLEGITPHRLRHTCCKRLYKAVGLVEANRIMRHKRLATTARYAEPSLEELAAAAEKISL